jgi:hypothetical protein
MHHTFHQMPSCNLTGIRSSSDLHMHHARECANEYQDAIVTWVGFTKNFWSPLKDNRGYHLSRMRESTCCHRTRAFLCVGPTDSTQDRISSLTRSNLWPTYPPCPLGCFCVQIGHRHALMTREILWARFQYPVRYHSWLRTCGTLTHTLSTHGRRRVTQIFPTQIIRDSPAPFTFVTLSRTVMPWCTCSSAINSLHNCTCSACPINVQFFLKKITKFFFNNTQQKKLLLINKTTLS